MLCFRHSLVPSLCYFPEGRSALSVNVSAHTHSYFYNSLPHSVRQVLDGHTLRKNIESFMQKAYFLPSFHWAAFSMTGIPNKQICTTTKKSSWVHSLNRNVKDCSNYRKASLSRLILVWILSWAGIWALATARWAEVELGRKVGIKPGPKPGGDEWRLDCGWDIAEAS